MANEIFKPGSRLLKKISDSFLFQNSLKLHERNKAGLFDSILMLGLKKFTSEFSSLTGQEMHIKKKKSYFLIIIHFQELEMRVQNKTEHKS